MSRFITGTKRADLTWPGEMISINSTKTAGIRLADLSRAAAVSFTLKTFMFPAVTSS